MIKVSPFRYADAVSVSNVSVSNGLIRLDVALLRADRPAAIALMAGAVPINYTRVVVNQTHPLTTNDRSIIENVVIGGGRIAYALDDKPTVKCAKSGKTLCVLPPLDNDNVAEQPQMRRLPLAEFLLELDPGHISDLASLLPEAVKFYQRHGKDRFIDAVYQSFLKRRPEPGMPEQKHFEEENLSESLYHFMVEVFNSDEARQFYIRRIPGPNSSDFLFRI